MKCIFHTSRKGDKEQYQYVVKDSTGKRIYILSTSNEDLANQPVEVLESVRVQGTRNKFFAIKVKPLYSKVILTKHKNRLNIKVLNPITFEASIEYNLTAQDSIIRELRKMAYNPHSLGWQTTKTKEHLLEIIYSDYMKMFDVH